jgi:1,4-alpha-glucan branching enzyme
MLYLHHGLCRNFTHYYDYFSPDVDEDAWVYLALANMLIHEINSQAITVAEDMSGMPGIALPIGDGGLGFDYRLGMGIPDYWVKLVKHEKDEHWHMGNIWHQLSNRRLNEKTISYVESHDQALVGDQTLIFRLIGDDMYHGMQIGKENIRVERGIALHKMIRLLTLAAGGEGYLNFMGNEFGHPEWIDFPREGNNWSYDYARRQWHLRYDTKLYYFYLAEFDQALIIMAKKYDVLSHSKTQLQYEHVQDQILAFTRAGLVFIFNFSPIQSHSDYRIYLSQPGKYHLLLSTDDSSFAGHHRLQSDQSYVTVSGRNNGTDNHFIQVYLPSRTALVLKANLKFP